MKRITQTLQLQILLIAFLTSTVYLHGQNIGFNTSTPAWQFQMVNVGNIGAATMGEFTNSGIDGVALSSNNAGLTNGFNGFEGVTYGVYSGVFGLGISDDNGAAYDANGVYGHANDWQGVGVYGVRSGAGGPDLGFGGLFINDLGYTGGLFLVSDKRLKKSISPIDKGIATIMNLSPVSYRFDNEKFPNLGLSNSLEYGFIAQDLEAILPNIVSDKQLDVNASLSQGPHQVNESQNESFKMVNYLEIIPILTKGMQEQQIIIEKQDKRISQLEDQLAELKKLVTELAKND